MKNLGVVKLCPEEIQNKLHTDIHILYIYIKEIIGKQASTTQKL